MNSTSPHPYRHWTIYLGLFLSALCLFTALRIEWYNAHALTKLPVPPDSGKWRAASTAGLSAKFESMYRYERNLPEDVPLTSIQQAEFDTLFKRRIELLDLDGDFRDFIGSFGLLQYLLVPTLFFLGIYTGLSSPQRNRFAISFALIAALCGLLMLYRNYVGSLGW